MTARHPLAIIAAIVIALIATPRPSSEPSPVPTTTGAPSASLAVPTPSPAAALPSTQRVRVSVPATPIRRHGVATWCRPTAKHCQKWGGDALLGAVPDFDYGDRPYPARIWRGERFVDVTVVSFCGCGERHGRPTIVDLSPAAFEQLGPLERGVLSVTVEAVQ